MPCHWQPRGERRCNGPKEPGTIFCDEHLCHNEKCPEPILSYDTWWCEKHSPCPIKSCTTPRYHSTGTCRTHACQFPKCPFPQYLPSSYCSGHKCHVDNCLRMRTPTNRFCDRHECTKANCWKLKEMVGGTVYCAAHTCRTPGCLEGKEGEEVEVCEGHGRGMERGGGKW